MLDNDLFALGTTKDGNGNSSGTLQRDVCLQWLVRHNISHRRGEATIQKYTSGTHTVDDPGHYIISTGQHILLSSARHRKGTNN